MPMMASACRGDLVGGERRPRAGRRRGRPSSAAPARSARAAATTGTPAIGVGCARSHEARSERGGGGSATRSAIQAASPTAPSTAGQRRRVYSAWVHGAPWPARGAGRVRRGGAGGTRRAPRRRRARAAAARWRASVVERSAAGASGGARPGARGDAARRPGRRSRTAGPARADRHRQVGAEPDSSAAAARGSSESSAKPSRASSERDVCRPRSSFGGCRRGAAHGRYRISRLLSSSNGVTWAR